MTRLIARCWLIAAAVCVNPAQAALIDNGGGLIYDTDLNVTWLANANGFVAYTYSGAQALASSANYGGVSGWQLPTTLQPDPTCSYQTGVSSGLNCSGSMLGHLYYTELGGPAGSGGISAHHNSNYSLFSNINNNSFWSSTPFPIGSGQNFYFGFSNGVQGAISTGATPPPGSTNTAAVWLVHAGDVKPVPLPAAAWLLLSGLGGLGVMRRKWRGAEPLNC